MQLKPSRNRAVMLSALRSPPEHHYLMQLCGYLTDMSQITIQNGVRLSAGSNVDMVITVFVM